MIQCLLCITNILSFLSGVLAWERTSPIAVQIAEILMEKLPETFSKSFVREGVVHAVGTLFWSEASVDKDTDSKPGSSSRSRRNRRRLGGTPNAEVTPSGNPKMPP